MSHDFLKGVRVIESSAFIAAPLAGLLLSELGADVIRIDLPGGGMDYGRMPTAPSGRSFYWTGLNKGKRSVAIDVRLPRGRELVSSLVTAPGCGILLTNLGSRWLSHATLARTRADVITCTIEGNPDGSTASDYTVNCATGYPTTTGGGSPGRPVNHVYPAWDVACAQHAVTGIVSAVERRRRTGMGAELRLALSDTAFAMLSHLGVLAEAEILGTERPSIGNDVYGAFGRDFATLDGLRVMVVAISDRQWRSLVSACEIEEDIAVLESAMLLDLDRETDRYAARDEIGSIIGGWIGRHPLGEVSRVFDRLGVCWGVYRTALDLVRNDARASTINPIFTNIETSGIGRHRAAGSPLRMIGEPRAATRPAPDLGDHTDEILEDVLRLPEAVVNDLRDRGVIR